MVKRWTTRHDRDPIRYALQPGTDVIKTTSAHQDRACLHSQRADRGRRCSTRADDVRVSLPGWLCFEDPRKLVADAAKTSFALDLSQKANCDIFDTHLHQSEL